MEREETRKAISSAIRQNLREEHSINFYPWQKKAIDLISHQQDEVLWIYDSVGASGKTELLKYLEHSSGFQFLFPMSLRKLCSFIDPEAEGYCFDVSRSITKEQIRTMHEVVEEIKKERAVQKRGDRVSLKSSTIVIASNSMPNLQLPAANRWLIMNVESGEILGNLKRSGKYNQPYNFSVYSQCL